MASGIKRRYVPGTQLAIDSPSFKPKEAKLEAKASDGPTIQVRSIFSFSQNVHILIVIWKK